MTVCSGGVVELYLPPGGSTEQVLAKASNRDYDFKWVTGGGGSSVTIGDTAPGSPAAGDLWFSSVDGSLSVYYDDGTSSQWVAVSGPQGTTGPAGAPGADGADGADGTTGIGVPAGGTAGQVLTKTSATDYATTWADQQITVSATAPASPTLNQLWLDIS